MVNLKALEAAINQVEKIREHELTFDAGGTRVSLRALRSHEETEIQRYAQIAFEDGSDETDQATFADFMDRLRHASLGFSVVQIGDLDLRNAEYVETGEADENGNPISLPKWEAVRDLIAREWSRPMLTQVFGKFGELLDRVDLFATERVKLDPVDAQEEIERLERRLEELRTAQANAVAEMPKDQVQRQQTAVRDLDRATAAQRDHLRSPAAPVVDAEATEAAPQQPPARRPASQPVPPAAPERAPQASAPEPPPQASPQPPAARQTALPTEGAPAPDRRPPEGMETARAAPEPPPPVDPRDIKFTESGDSFFDPSDPDAALEAETRRQLMFRRHKEEQERARQEAMEAREQAGIPTNADLAKQRMAAQRAGQLPQAVRVDARTQGLRDAANASDATFDAGAGSIRTGRPVPQRPQPQGPGKAAKLHGKPVYKMPTQTLDRPAREAPRGPERQTTLTVNPDGPAGSRNENFRGPGEQ